MTKFQLAFHLQTVSESLDALNTDHAGTPAADVVSFSNRPDSRRLLPWIMAGRHVLHLNVHGQPTGVLNVRCAHAGAEVPRHRLQSDGASTSGRHSPEVLWSPSQRRCSVQCSVAAPDREQKTIQLEAVRFDDNTSSAASTSALLCDPESFTLTSGQLSTVAQEASQRPEDVFRCSGCSLQECQVQNACNLHCMLHCHAVFHKAIHAGANWMCTNAVEELP